jgi:ATP/ADP translocase
MGGVRLLRTTDSATMASTTPIIMKITSLRFFFFFGGEKAAMIGGAPAGGGVGFEAGSIIQSKFCILRN